MSKFELEGCIVVSGCPRSGTSAMMSILCELYGENRLMGTKHFEPLEYKTDMDRIIAEENNTKRKNLFIYMQNKKSDERQREIKERREELEQAKELNPKGFFEHLFTIQGIRYHPAFKEELAGVIEEFKILKVVSSGLLNSDPIYISKIVYMLRHPRVVAKSQENLLREGGAIDENGEYKIDDFTTHKKGESAPEKLNIHTPKMFINACISALIFFQKNPEIPIKIIQFEDLDTDTDNIIDSVHDFTGAKGDLKSAKKIWDKKLNRSKREDVDNILWDEAEYMYEVMLKLQKLFDNNEPIDELIDSSLEFMRDRKRELNKANARWFCARAKRQVNAHVCQRCMVDLNFRKHYKKYSERKIEKNINHWRKEPCAFECGMDVERKTYIDVEYSIYENFWEENEILDLDELRK